ncbi:MAG: S41 family peptidase, partial [Bacteroidota bacterium]
TQYNLDAFSPSADQSDDQINAGTYEFFDLVQEHWVEAIDKTKGYYEEALGQAFDLKTGGEITLRGEDADWVKNDKELKQYWHDYIKRDVLNQITNRLEDQENDESVTDAEKKSAEEIEVEVRAKTLKRYNKWYERMQKSKLSIRRSQYLNALTAQYDPHTSYYRPKDKESFDIRFSGQLEGIGATLQNDESYTKVSTIVVGGPAWKAGELEVDDLIMAVRQGGEEKVLDIKDMLVEDVVQHIRGDKGTTVHLKVKKPDGTIREISIVRDVVIIDESYAKSLIVDGKGESETIGYLNLPSFYANFNDENGRFSAKDVKAELQKLQNNDVEGIILDLRNNGG